MAISMWLTQHGAALGERLDEGSVPWTPPDELLTQTETPLLYGVDRYDDTRFNSRQCELLKAEISHLRAQSLSDDQAAMLTELERLAEQTARPPHRYLVFVGD